MPPIQRKLIGPESSFSYKLYTRKDTLGISDTSKKSEEPRRVYIKMGVLSKVKGSAYIEIGRTKIIAATFGARELSIIPKKTCLGSLQCEVKYASFGIENSNAPQISKREKIYSVALKKALQPLICRNEFTNFQINIFVYVLQDDGCVLSSAINCAGIALIDGGLAMYDLITATTIGFHNQTVFVDPSYIEEDHCINGDENDEFGIVVLSRLESHSQTSDCFQLGCLTFDTLRKANNIAFERSQNILQKVKQVLLRKVRTNLTDNEK